MTRRLITFLGTTDYKSLTYALPGGKRAVETRFVARAIAELMHCEAVVVMATDAAWQENGADLTAALGEIGRKPIHVPIPDGKNEAELREQFRALTEAIDAAEGGVVIDITHGFRAQPFFASTALATLAASGDLPEDTRITYGAREATDENGVTPIWDLTPFLMLQDLAHGIATLKRTGHGQPLIDALKRETARLSERMRAGERDGYDETKHLVNAVAAFCNDLATLRVPMLITGPNGKESTVRRLRDAIAEYRDRCRRDHPALVPLLDDLADMAEPLSADTLFGDKGKRAMLALARLYLAFNRPLEAAAIAREGYVSLFADGPGATDAGRDGFEMGARSAAEGRASRTDTGRFIAGTRNDLLHAGMRKRPESAANLQENARKAVEHFAQAEPQPRRPDQSARAFLVTRHAGALEWARRQGIDAEAVAHLDPKEIRPGDTVLGTLPVHLVAEVCAQGGRYLHLVLDLPPEARGRDLTADDMERYGAHLQEFRVWGQ